MTIKNITEKSLQQKLWTFCFEMSSLESTIGMSLKSREPYNPEADLASIDQVKVTLQKLYERYHPDTLDEDTLHTMCEQLDALARKIYIAYASCKATGLRELYIEDLRTLFGQVRDVVAPAIDKDTLHPGQLFWQRSS